MKRLIKGADEQDTFTSWRRYYTYLARPGVASSIKRRARRRERAAGRREARQA